MKAWVIPSQVQLGLQNLQLVDMPEPQPAAGQLLIAVHAVGLNPADYKLAQLSDASWEYPHILGLDLAGVIAQVGSDVEGFSVGDRVCAHIDLAGQGCFAEFAVAPAYCVARIPDKVTFAEAAGMMSTGITAYQALHRKANLSNRRTALIHAGSGGVGSMAVQLAKEAGLTVYTTVPGNAKDFVRELGADVAIDFETEDFVEEIKKQTDGQGVDFILDPLNQRHVDQNIDLLAFNGDIVCLTTPPSTEAVGKMFWKGLGLHLVYVGAVHQSKNMQQMQDLSIMAKSMLSLIEEGKVRVPIARTFAFSELPLALATLQKEPPLGKFVVAIE